jgi:dihydrofolate reductase
VIETGPKVAPHDPVAKLVYSAIASLDGFVEDESGGFGWAAPSEELHAFVNDQEREVGTYLYGRRMYETMRYWELPEADSPDKSRASRDYAQIWRGADKVVYSRSLERVETERTRLVREFEPEAVRDLVAASDRDVSIGGPELAAAAFRAGLVDEVHLFLHPVVVGGGKPALPRGVELGLELLGVGRFDDGVVHLHHSCTRS